MFGYTRVMNNKVCFNLSKSIRSSKKDWNLRRERKSILTYIGLRKSISSVPIKKTGSWASHFPLTPRPVVAHPRSLLGSPLREKNACYLNFYRTTGATRRENK